MPRQRTTKPDAAVPEPIEETPEVETDAGALIAKERCGPVREKYPMTEGAANFATFSQTITNPGKEPA